MIRMAQAVEIGQRMRVRLEGWGRLGEALAQHEDVPLFVFGGIDGEEVEAEVVRRHRRYLAARVVRVIEGSKHRVEPPCPHFGACTGCQWQHVEEGHQRELKRLAVVDALERIGGLEDAPVADILPAPVHRSDTGTMHGLPWGLKGRWVMLTGRAGGLSPLTGAC